MRGDVCVCTLTAVDRSLAIFTQKLQIHGKHSSFCRANARRQVTGQGRPYTAGLHVLARLPLLRAVRASEWVWLDNVLSNRLSHHLGWERILMEARRLFKVDAILRGTDAGVFRVVC